MGLCENRGSSNFHACSCSESGNLMSSSLEGNMTYEHNPMKWPLCLASFEATSLLVCVWLAIHFNNYLKSFADLTVHPCFVWSMAVVGRGAPWFLCSDCRKRTASVVEKKDAIGKLSEASMGSWGRISMDSPCQSLPWPLAALRSMTFQRHHDVNGPIFFHDT